MNVLSKEEWLDRCAMAYDVGLARPEVLGCLERGADTFLRLVAVEAHKGDPQPGDDMQRDIANGTLKNEAMRLRHSDSGAMVLASDKDGYGAVQLSAILVHFCQQCATDPKAWWTRQGFCEHRGDGDKATAALD